MRFSDFKYIVSEETLQPVSIARPGNSNYYRNLINAIRSKEEIQVTLDKTKTSPKLVKTVKFSSEAADRLEAIWNPTGRDKLESPDGDQLEQIKTVLLPAKDGAEYRVNQIEKTGAIKQKVGEKPGEKTYSKWWNDGNVAEAIMASAVLTKFEKEGAELEANDIFGTAQRIEGTTIKSTAFGKAIELNIALAGEDFKAFIMSARNPQEFLKYENSKQVYKMFSDCATYVNQSSAVKSALEKIKNADTKDVISVTADGATHEAQHSTKADLWIALNGTKEKLLSIKTSTVKHIGGHAGYEFDKIDTFLNSVLGIQLPEEIKQKFKMVPLQFSPKNPPADEKGNLLFPDWKKGDPAPEGYLYSKEREPIAKAAREYNSKIAIPAAYKYVDNQLTKLLADNTGEYNFVKEVTTGVVHHATLGQDVRVVVISPSAKEAYKELSFGPEFHEALKNYNLTHELTVSEKTCILKIYGFATTDLGKRINNGDSMFVQLRTYNQDKTTRNVVEMGGLLKKLTDITQQEGANTASSFDTRAKPVFDQPTSTSPAKTKTEPNAAVKATTTQAPMPAVPTSQQPTAVSQQSQLAQLANGEEEVAEEQHKWQPHKDEHVSELQRMLHLAKYSH